MEQFPFSSGGDFMSDEEERREQALHLTSSLTT